MQTFNSGELAMEVMPVTVLRKRKSKNKLRLKSDCIQEVQWPSLDSSSSHEGCGGELSE